MVRTKELYLYIKEELLNLAYKNLLASSFAVIVNSIILVYLLWGEVSNSGLSIWLILMSLITVFRFISAYRFKLYKEEYSIESWNRIFLWGIVLSAILWGSVSLLLFPSSIEYQMIVIIILVGMGAGATSSVASHIKAIRLFLFFILTPLVIRLFLEDTFIYNTLAILTIIFLIMLLVVSKQFYTTIYNNVETKLLFKQAKDKLKVTQGSFQTIFNQAPVGIFYYNENLKVNQLNREFAKILQVPQELLIGLDLTKLPDTRVFPAINTVLDGNSGYYEGEYITKFKQITIWVTLQTSPIHNANGEIIGGVGIVNDITSKVEAQKKIEYQAFYDSLTDLPNRSMLIDRLEQAIIHYRTHGTISAILFLD
ncbi:MAG: PAS domain S-box protein, partial [Campylobacterota bacterium]|nr:PAS domain S-box protein [Campylobacterota bacterium]